MPPTLMNAAVGALLAVALLGAAFDRRSLALVVVAAALPDLDALLGLVVPGAANAALHALWLPLLVGLLLYWDTCHRSASWLGDRYGWRGVRVAWVTLAGYAVAGVGLDLFNMEAVNLLYPVHDRFYAVVGKLVISTREGVVQTYVQPGPGLLPVQSPGSGADYHVSSWVNPRAGRNPAGVERRLRFVESGWQVALLLAATAAVLVRSRGGR